MIDSVLVENNVDPATGQDAADHLEIALTNSGTTELTGFEVFYTFTDPTDDLTESYYLALPTDFTIPPAGSRVVHFDDTGAVDHFPENTFSLYHTSVNAHDVEVRSAPTVRPYRRPRSRRTPAAPRTPTNSRSWGTRLAAHWQAML